MDERYVVISTRHQVDVTAKGNKKKPGLIPAGANADGNIASVPDSTPRMVVDIVDRAAVAKHKRQPGFEAGAPSMPMSLITPLASAAAAAGPIMWGVSAVRADTSAFDGSNVTIAWTLSPPSGATFHQLTLLDPGTGVVVDHLLLSSATSVSATNVRPGNYRVRVSSGNACGIRAMVPLSYLDFTVP